MPTMKNHATPRTLADCDFRVGNPIIPTRRARILETIGGAAVILALVLFTAWVITGA
jgi:hypothetical protein